MKTEVTIWWGAERKTVTAYPTPVPGLVINDDGRPGIWVVTHAASGVSVLRLPDPEAALFAAIRLGELADWLLPGTELRALPGMRAKVNRLARELCCYELTYGQTGVISDEQLAATETGGPS